MNARRHPTDSPTLPLTRSALDARDVALGAAPLVAGTIVGLATNSSGSRWFRRLDKPAWTPPDAVFGPVWTVLYVLMGAASVVVARAGRGNPVSAGDRVARPRADRALGLFAAQLVLNLVWSVLFFGARRPKAAGVELALLWSSIAMTVIAFARVRLVAGLLLLPYLAWTTFAGLLNAEIIRRNPDA